MEAADGCFFDRGEGEADDDVLPFLEEIPSSRPSPAGEVEEEEEEGATPLGFKEGEVEVAEEGEKEEEEEEEAEAGDLDLRFDPPPRMAVCFPGVRLDVEVDASGWRGDPEEEEGEAIRQRREEKRRGKGMDGSSRLEVKGRKEESQTSKHSFQPSPQRRILMPSCT